MKSRMLLFSGVLLLGLSLCGLTGCKESSEGNQKVVIKMAHNQIPESQVAKIVQKFADYVNAADAGMEIEIYASGVLGAERDVIELVKNGDVDMAKVGASSLDQFNRYYSIFSLPYVFQSTEHYYNALENSEAVKEIKVSGEKDGYIALGFYPSGARSAYLVEDKPITDPSVLKGKKMRVMQSPTAKKMIGLMGGAGVPMAMAEVYTSLQQGLLDGAENTEMVLTVNKHGEVAKAYTYTEHQYTPDVVIISTKTLAKLTDAQKKVLEDAMAQNYEDYKASYNNMIADARAEAEAMGVHFYRIDKTPFIEAVQPLHEEYKAQGEDLARFYDDIQKYIIN